MNVIFYGFQFAHHGKHTAFLALKRVLEKNGIRVVSAPRPQFFFKRGFRRLLKPWMKIQEYILHRYYISDSISIIHYFFPENSLFHATKWIGKTKLIMTCHQPVTNGHFERIGKINPYFIDGIKNADVILLMASNDIQIYKNFAPQAEVLCIPHGVDTSFFSRDNMSHPHEKKERKNILTVGNWLRDYKFWADVVKEVLRTRDDIEFTVIAMDDLLKEIRSLFNDTFPSEVDMLSGISDEELRDAYEKSDLLFLPLIDAWANNAILEAASMGIPIMVSDLPAVREYLGDDLAIYFTNNSAEDTANRLLEILTDENKLVQKGKALRMRMENEFSWEKITEHHISLYERLD